MPNVEHLKILDEGVQAWNVWRQMQQEGHLYREDTPRPALDGAGLRGFDLRGVTSTVLSSTAPICVAPISAARTSRTRIYRSQYSSGRASSKRSSTLCIPRVVPQLRARLPHYADFRKPNNHRLKGGGFVDRLKPTKELRDQGLSSYLFFLACIPLRQRCLKIKMIRFLIFLSVVFNRHFIFSRECKNIVGLMKPIAN